MDTTKKLAEALRDAQIKLRYSEVSLEQFSYMMADLVEKSGIKIMPFNIGDKLYRASGWLEEVDTLTVSMITLKKDNSWKIRCTSDHYKSVADYTLDQLHDSKYQIFSDYDQAVAEHIKNRKELRKWP